MRCSGKNSKKDWRSSNSGDGGGGPRCLPFLLEASISQVHAPLTGRGSWKPNEQIKVCPALEPGKGTLPQILKKQKEPRGHTREVRPQKNQRERGKEQDNGGGGANLTTSSNLKHFQRRPFLRSDHKSSSLEELLTPQTHQYNISCIQSEDRSKQGTPEHTILDSSALLTPGNLTQRIGVRFGATMHFFNPVFSFSAPLLVPTFSNSYCFHHGDLRKVGSPGG